MNSGKDEDDEKGGTIPLREVKTVTTRTNRQGTAVPAARRRRRRRRKLSPFARLLIVAVIALAGGALGVWRLLRVGSVTVAGDAGYPAAQVVSASGVKAGMPLFAVNGREAARKVCSALPMVDTARVSYSPPTGIVIAVTKDSAAYVASAKEGVAVLDRGWKVLAVEKDSSRYPSLPLINGVAFGPVAPGEKITGAPLSQLQQARAILTELRSAHIDKVVNVNLSSSYQLTVNYDNRVSILLGTASDIPYKLKFAAALLASRVGATEKGTLDVSQSAQNNRASFIPS